jgi:hypothetical protein
VEATLHQDLSSPFPYKLDGSYCRGVTMRYILDLRNAKVDAGVGGDLVDLLERADKYRDYQSLSSRFDGGG